MGVVLVLLNLDMIIKIVKILKNLGSNFFWQIMISVFTLCIKDISFEKFKGEIKREEIPWHDGIENLNVINSRKSYDNGKLILMTETKKFGVWDLCPGASMAFDVTTGYLADEIIKKAEDTVDDWKINKAYTSEKGRKNLKDFIKRQIGRSAGSIRCDEVDFFCIDEIKIKKLQDDNFKIVKLSSNGETQLLPLQQ